MGRRVRAGQRNKVCTNYWRCLQLLRNPCPAASCTEQVSRWTQEREERHGQEGRRRAALTEPPQSPETVTDCNRRLRDDPPHTVDTPKYNDAHFSQSLPRLLKKARAHTHTEQGITPAECIGVMFVWNIFIPLWLRPSLVI